MNKIPFVDLKAQYASISEEIQTCINSVILNTNFIMGEEVKSFEKNFSKFIDAKYTVALSSGTDALFLALIALGIQKGDEVITSPFTFTATSEAIWMTGAKPVFVDIEPNSFNIDTAKIEEKINKKTKAILPIHLYGQPADMSKILKLARKYKLAVIEDAAQAHGAKYNKKTIGTFGNISAFSFYPAKNLGAYGDAGAISTNNEKLAQKVSLLRNHGRSEKYLHQILGYGHRMDTIQAAVLNIKLKHLRSWNQKRRKAARLYNKILSKLPITLPHEPPHTKSVYHIYAIRMEKRDMVRAKLSDLGIETGIHYPLPLHLQPAYKYLGYKKGDFPESEKAANEVLSLPMFPEITEKQIIFVKDSLEKIIFK